MKRIIMLVNSVTISVFLHAQLSWDGGGDGISWNDPANWSADILPDPGDNIVLDNTITSGDYTVMLPPGPVSITVRSLTVTPSAGIKITIVLPATNTAIPGFTATGNGDAVILNRGAVFRNSSGAASGTPVTVTSSNFFRINDGGHYIHNTPRGHAELVGRLSSQPGTEDGIFEFDVPGLAAYTISVSNRVYGHLVFSASAAGTVKTYTGGGSGAFTVNGNLDIKPHAVLSYGPVTNIVTIQKNCFVDTGAYLNISNGGNNSIFHVKGDIDIRGILTETGSSSGSNFLLMGNTSQQVNIASIQNTVVFGIDNPAGAVLLAPLILPHHLRLINGKIRTSSVNLLTLLNDGGYAGGSVSSFIEGPMKKIGDDDFLFPVGKGSIYAPVGIWGAEGSVTDEYMAEYHRRNPQSIYGGEGFYGPGIHHISYVEYWTLQRLSGNVSKQVSLDVHPESFCKSISNTFVSRWSGSSWIKELSVSNLTGMSGIFQTGNVITEHTTAGFGNFTLATDQPDIKNPLPVIIKKFDAKTSAGITMLNWELADICSRNTQFEIQKAGASRQFVTVATMQCNGMDRVYQFRDDNKNNGLYYYRVKIKQDNGRVYYSDITSVVIDIKNTLICSISPNPARDIATLIMSSVRPGNIMIEVFDLAGRRVKQWRPRVNKGENRISFSLAGLPAGIYFWRINSCDGCSYIQCLKQ